MISVVGNTVFNNNKKIKTFNNVDDASHFANAIRYMENDYNEEDELYESNLITSYNTFKAILENSENADNQLYAYIVYLNAKNNFKKTVEVFTDYDEALKWGKENIENFNSDMINYGLKETIDKIK